MSFTERLVGSGDERAQHELTLRRTLVAIGWGALASIVLVAAAVAVSAGIGAAASGWTFAWVALQYVGAVVLSPLLVIGALWVLRRSGSGRLPRILVGLAVGLVLGLVEQLLFTGMSPLELIRTEPDLAFLVLGVPPIAGAVAGALVGPRPALPPASEPGPDERAEDSLPGPA